MGAGAPHALTKAEKDDQITRDVPRTSFRIMGEEFGCAMGENVEGNIREKLVRKLMIPPFLLIPSPSPLSFTLSSPISLL